MAHYNDDCRNHWNKVYPTVTISTDGQRLKVTADRYSKNLVDYLKGELPQSARTWKPDPDSCYGGSWLVRQEYAVEAVAAMRRMPIQLRLAIGVRDFLAAAESATSPEPPGVA